LVGLADYPDAPLFVDRLKVKFLRRVRAMPIAAAEDRATLAMADPLDVFARDAVAAALGYPVRVAVAVPIELEAAIDRLYATSDEAGDDAALLDEVTPDAEPAEEDAERLKDLASEAPVIRLVNQLIARAVETHASDVHLEPFPDRLRVRYRYDGVLHEIEPPNGMVLVTGPTGSGKTTTLYTGLLKLNTVARNVVTVEDPIEYQLGGINQIQVKPQIGLNFASLLRSILRQDPDVIMIGEIRDLETAQIAVQAALTGHLVLSTVHTNSAAASVTRLRET